MVSAILVSEIICDMYLKCSCSSEIDSTTSYVQRPKHDDVTLSLLQRAKKSGYTALIVTLDTNLLGWRPEDLKKAYLPFLHGVGCQSEFYVQCTLWFGDN